MMTDLYDRYLQNPKICTDTRKISKGCIFFALKGPNFNGNEFAKEALKKGASLGEMALLDNETRSADAVAKEDSVLLKINQDVFYELMESNADIMKQIIKLLTSRIRKANVKLETNLK